jgi:lysozyme family protein
MKGNFDQCLSMVLKHEGGFVDHPKDPGGATNMGVTLGTYEQWVGRSVTVEEMKALAFDDVAPIYRKNYWDRVRGDDLPSGVDWSRVRLGG